MKLLFHKMQGLGNDFIVIDAYTSPVYLSAEQIRYISDRHYGIGCDQVLILEQPLQSNTDFGYRIYNATGEEVGQCGNGARCLAKFIVDQALSKKNKFKLSTQTSIIEVDVLDHEQVTVNMGLPRFAAHSIPVDLSKKPVEMQLQLSQDEITGVMNNSNQRPIPFGIVSMGNPHLVFQVQQLAAINIHEMGKQFSLHDMFPEQCNVGFMQIINHDEIQLKVYERHVGTTEACGSGACAAMVIGRLNAGLSEKIKVIQPGGELIISWQGRGYPVWMQGPAKFVFSGEIEL